MLVKSQEPLKMSKDTDYKRLWRTSQDTIRERDKEIDRLNRLIEGYVDIIERIKTGEIIVDKVETKND